MSTDYLPSFLDKMREDGASENAMAFFSYAYDYLRSGQTGLVREEEIEPLSSILSYEDDVMASVEVEPELLRVCFFTFL